MRSGLSRHAWNGTSDAGTAVWRHRHEFRPGPVEILVEQRVVEAGCSGRVAVRGEVDPAHTGPEGRGEAQRARLTAGVEHGAAEIEVGGRSRGRPDGHHFGVRRGIVIPRDPVDAFMDPAVGSDHQRPERPAAVGHTSGGEPDRLIEEAVDVPG